MLDRAEDRPTKKVNDEVSAEIALLLLQLNRDCGWLLATKKGEEDSRISNSRSAAFSLESD